MATHEFNKDERRALKLSVGIISLQQAILNGQLPDQTISLMEQKNESALKEFNSLLLKLDLNQLIKKLDG